MSSQHLRPKNRCYLVYALAPADANTRACNHLFNDYISDRRRGIVVFHDHFVGTAGGIAIFDVHSDDAAKMLDDPGPLSGWNIEVYGLAHSLTAVGLAAQMDYTLTEYGRTSFDKLRAEEEPKKRHWWSPEDR